MDYSVTVRVSGGSETRNDKVIADKIAGALIAAGFKVGPVHMARIYPRASAPATGSGAGAAE